MRRYEVIAGHHGILPLGAPDALLPVVTVLREPAARAWSHYRAVPWPAEPLAFADFLDHPVYGWAARDYQACWLGVPPAPGEARWKPAAGAALPAPPDVLALHHADLACSACRTLERCGLAGTVERIDDFVEALGRLLGRRLPPVPRINVGPPGIAAPEREAAAARSRSPLDVALHERAGDALDRALTTLPALPEEAPGALPYRQTMEQPLCGTGWHARVHTAEAGWHRWTGPGLRSDVRLPVRLAGAARLALAIVSACDDDAVRSLRLTVQGRHVAHVLEPRPIGVAAVADVELDARSPLTVELEVAHTRGHPEPAGLAIGEIALS